MKRKTIEPTSTPDIDAEIGNRIEEIISDNEELYQRLARRKEFASAVIRVIDEDRELRVLKVPGTPKYKRLSDAHCPKLEGRRVWKTLVFPDGGFQPPARGTA